MKWGLRLGSEMERLLFEANLGYTVTLFEHAKQKELGTLKDVAPSLQVARRDCRPCFPVSSVIISPPLAAAVLLWIYYGCGCWSFWFFQLPPCPLSKSSIALRNISSLASLNSFPWSQQAVMGRTKFSTLEQKWPGVYLTWWSVVFGFWLWVEFEV